MQYRRLVFSDIAGVLALQEANLLANLTEAQRAQGYLSARFEAAQFERMDRDAAVVVAAEGTEVVGYACADTVDAAAKVPILDAMLRAFPKTAWLGVPLADTRACIYGPVCVRHDLRGQGVFRRLVAELKQALAGRFDVAVAFIAKSNARSLGAHVDGLGMLAAGEFSFGGNAYWIVCFGIPAADLACGVGPRPA